MDGLWPENEREPYRLPEVEDELWNEAKREDWARTKVREAGESWATHLAKFDGTVLPR